MRKILNKKGDSHIMAIVISVAIFSALAVGLGIMYSNNNSKAAVNSNKTIMSDTDKTFDAIQNQIPDLSSL